LIGRFKLSFESGARQTSIFEVTSGGSMIRADAADADQDLGDCDQGRSILSTFHFALPAAPSEAIPPADAV
jgi:hypothetical protein